jgi:hypothetical protein
MLTQDKITEIYCAADEFCKKFDQEFENLKKMPKPASLHVSVLAKCPIIMALNCILFATVEAESFPSASLRGTLPTKAISRNHFSKCYSMTGFASLPALNRI